MCCSHQIFISKLPYIIWFIYIMKFMVTFYILITFYVKKGNEDTLNMLLDNELSLEHTLKVRNDLPPCNEDQLMMYLAEIQVINPEGIINLSTLEDLTKLCNKVWDSLTRTDFYLKTCDPPQQKDLYLSLIQGVNALYHKLCTEGPFKKKFQRYYKCYHNLHNDFQECAAPADWAEDEDEEKVCKAYKEIMECYYARSAKACGKEAAEVIKELITNVLSSVLVIKCDIKLDSAFFEMSEVQTKNLSTVISLHLCILRIKQ